MFTTPYRETSRSAELLEAWKSAAHDTRVAWYAWLASDHARCVIGDGEAETGPLAASWHSNKFLKPDGR